VKKSILFFITFGFVKILMAQSSVDVCSNNLKMWFSANTYESQSICKENSSHAFMKCMENKSNTSSQDVVTSSHDCDRRSTHSEHPIRDTRYLSFQSCEGELQAGARMRPDRAHQICRWNSKPVMISCLVNLVRKANWHSEHAIQYCDFANQSYPREIPNFVKCAVRESPRGLGVEKTAQVCHDEILARLIPNRRQKSTPQPLPEVRPPEKSPTVVTRKPPTVAQPVEQRVVVEEKSPNVVSQQSPTVSQPVEQTVVVEEKKVRTVVPTPVEIQVQESAKPEVISDQKAQAESSSNSENLPLD
jgi:hypothetical protein